MSSVQAKVMAASRSRAARLGAALATAAAVVAVVGLPAGALVPRPEGASNPLTAGHPYRHGIVPSRTWLRSHPSSAVFYDSSNNLEYWGGISDGSGDTVGVTTGHEKVYLVFWGSQWGTQGTNSSGDAMFTGDSKAMAPYLQEFFKGLGTGGETWSGVMTQYCDSQTFNAQDCGSTDPHVAYPTGGALAGVWEDASSSAPASATGHQIGVEALAAAHHFGNLTQASNLDAQYVVVSPTGTNPDNYENDGFCAWHDYTGDGSLDGGGAVTSDVGQFAFTNLPYLPDAGGGCGAGFVNGGNALDGVSIVEGHEYAETITDQFPGGGWFDTSGNETGDKCAWISSGQGAAADITLATGTFAVQSTWANDFSGGTGGCEISHAIVSNQNIVSVTNPGAQTGRVGKAVNLQLKATDSDTSQTLTYGATGLPSGLSINTSTGDITGTPTTASGSSVTVSATDATSAKGSATFSWTISPKANVVTVTNPGAQDTTIESGVRLAVHAADSAAGQTLTYSATGLPTGVAIAPSTGLVTGTTKRTGRFTVVVKATDTTSASGSATFSWTVAASVAIANGGFEKGSLAGWTATGAKFAVSTTAPHSGKYDALLGAPTPTKGDSSITQTFVVPSGAKVLSFWYEVTCLDTVAHDWATAVLTDGTSKTSVTVLPRTCTKAKGWVEVAAPVVAGHTYTIKLTNHDDDASGNPTFTRFDDVTVGP